MTLFAQRLKHLRISNKISQKDFAATLDMIPGSYQKYEYGTREPNFDTLNKIADYFNVSTDFLLGHGIFYKWNSILENKDSIIQELFKVLPEEKLLSHLKLIFDNDSNHLALIRFLPLFIEDIEFDADNNLTKMVLTF